MAGPAFLLHGMIEATISEAIFSVPPASRDAFQQPFHKVLLMATRAHAHTHTLNFAFAGIQLTSTAKFYWYNIAPSLIKTAGYITIYVFSLKHVKIKRHNIYICLILLYSKISGPEQFEPSNCLCEPIQIKIK